MKGNGYTLCYAAILGSACALLLTFVSNFTEPYRKANEEAEKNLNILLALNVPFEQGASAEQLVEVYNANVHEKNKDDLTLYEYASQEDKDTILAVAVKFAGPGLWGPVEGFLAMEPDMKTIRGITFFKQEETPGLGGEIAAPWFTDQFKGKSIVGADGKVGIVIGGGGMELAINEVDAISGATMTCDKVQAMLNEVIEKL